MNSLVAEVAVAIVPVPVPVVVDPIGVERLLGGRAQPKVVVDFFGDGTVGLVADRSARFVTKPLGHVNLPELARSQKRDGVLDSLVAAALRAGLNDPVVLAGGVNDPAPFGNIVANRLLDVDM